MRRMARASKKTTAHPDGLTQSQRVTMAARLPARVSTLLESSVMPIYCSEYSSVTGIG